MKIKKITDENILFDDGTKIISEHNQDCCENVYADFKQLKDTDILSKDFKKIEIEGVKDSGIRLNGYFIPCYNEQNGYYGSDLEIIIKYPNGDKLTKDISEFVEDRID